MIISVYQSWIWNLSVKTPALTHKSEYSILCTKLCCSAPAQQDNRNCDHRSTHHMPGTKYQRDHLWVSMCPAQHGAITSEWACIWHNMPCQRPFFSICAKLNCTVPNQCVWLSVPALWEHARIISICFESARHRRLRFCVSGYTNLHSDKVLIHCPAGAWTSDVIWHTESKD